MNILAAVMMLVVVSISIGGSIYEKKIRKNELERNKIAANLTFDDGYERRVLWDEFYLGSGKNADVRVLASSEDVASIHAYFYREGEYFYIQNVAKNVPIYVTHVDGTTKVSYRENTILKNGSRIRIGKHKMTFKRGG